MPFDWRFRNFKRDPEPFLNGAVIDAENARNNLVQNAGNGMEGYTPLESTLAAQAMEGYKPVVPATQSQLAAGASQAMEGYTPNSAGRPSVPNDMHGSMGQPDLDGYGESLQAASDAAGQAQAREQQIADIESQIATLEKRIAENQAKLKNWNGDEVVNKVAALEARKFFSQDPTSIWRWKVDRDEARRIAKMEKDKTKQLTAANAMYEIQNDLDSIIVDDTMTSQDKKAYLSKLSNMKTLGEKAGVPKSVIDSINAKIDEVKGENKSGREEQSRSEYKKGTKVENADNAADELLAKPDLTQGDIAKFKRDNPNISDGKLLELNKKHNELIDRDKKKNESIKKARGLVGKKNLNSNEIEFMSGMKGFKKKSDDYGNIWFEEVL